MGAFKNWFKTHHSKRDSPTCALSPSPSSPSSSSSSSCSNTNTSPNPTTATYYAPPSSGPVWAPNTQSSSSRPYTSGFGPRNLGEPRPWSHYASASSNSSPPQWPTRAYPAAVASANTPHLAAIGNMMFCQQMSTVRLDSETDTCWSYHPPPALATPPRASIRPPLPRPPSSSSMPAISASTLALPQQSVKAVPGKIHPSPWRDNVQDPASGSHLPSRPSQHSYHSSTPTGPPPIPPKNVFPAPAPIGPAPLRPALTLYPQAIPLEPKATLPSPPKGPDPFRQTVPPSPQLPAGLPDRGGAGAEIGLGRPGSMQPFRPADHERSRNITPQLPGAFPKSAGIEATTLPPSAGINPERLPNKPIEAPTQKIVSPTSNPGRENLTPTKTPSSAQRRSGISKAHTPTSTSSSKPRVQCSGTTTSNKRCTRMVESTSGDLSSPGPLHGLHLASYCHQHLKTSLSEPGCFVLSNTRGGEHWVEYADWILSDLDERTKVLLRSEMSNAVSGMDSEGYLYVHEFPPTSSTTSTTYLKIGRSVKPLSRLSQWKNQCPSRKPIVRDVLPRANSTSRPVGATMHFAERGAPNHHRWERLVLIEVAGRAKMMALCSDQGKKEGYTTGSPPCGDCGQRHIEMFEVGKGAYDLWVRDVLERWERWCRDVIG